MAATSIASKVGIFIRSPGGEMNYPLVDVGTGMKFRRGANMPATGNSGERRSPNPA